MTSATTARESHGGVTRLVDAERRWQSALADARARASDVIATAQADADAIARTAEQSLAAAVDARRREQNASLPMHTQTARDELAARTRKYTGASDDSITRAAAMIADRAPWLRSAETTPTPEAR